MLPVLLLMMMMLLFTGVLSEGLTFCVARRTWCMREAQGGKFLAVAFWCVSVFCVCDYLLPVAFGMCRRPKRVLWARCEAGLGLAKRIHSPSPSEVSPLLHESSPHCQDKTERTELVVATLFTLLFVICQPSIPPRPPANNCVLPMTIAMMVIAPNV